MAKTLWFTNTVASTHRGTNSAKLNGSISWWLPKLFSESRGDDTSGSPTTSAFSLASNTTGIETSPAGGLDPTDEWISEPLSADFTISGTITLNLWAAEGGMNDNAAINAVIDKIDGATGALTQIVKTARVTELTTTSAVWNFTVTPTSTACKRGDRLRVRVFIGPAGTMGANVGIACSMWYDRSSAGVLGDSYITFTENLTFEPVGDPGYIYVENL